VPPVVPVPSVVPSQPSASHALCLSCRYRQVPPVAQCLQSCLRSCSSRAGTVSGASSWPSASSHASGQPSSHAPPSSCTSAPVVLAPSGASSCTSAQPSASSCTSVQSVPPVMPPSAPVVPSAPVLNLQCPQPSASGQLHCTLPSRAGEYLNPYSPPYPSAAPQSRQLRAEWLNSEQKHCPNNLGNHKAHTWFSQVYKFLQVLNIQIKMNYSFLL